MDQLRKLARASDQIVVSFDPILHVAWCRLRPRGRACFNPGILAELRRYQRLVQRLNQAAIDADEPPPIRYAVLGSAIPHVYNLGGDLELFLELIRRRDRHGLVDYAETCVGAVHCNHIGFDQPVTTISLVQGDALGGGFEAALSSQVVIAEESAKFGLPEALFNLVPGMGACSFLLRRLHPHAAKRMILSGEIKTAREMLALGLVDVVAADGDGEREVERFIRRHEKHANAHHALNQIHRLIEPVSYDELMAVTEIWVDAALRLHERDLRMMEHLVGAQNRQLHHREPEAPAGRHQVPSVP